MCSNIRGWFYKGSRITSPTQGHHTMTPQLLHPTAAARHSPSYHSSLYVGLAKAAHSRRFRDRNAAVPVFTTTTTTLKNQYRKLPLFIPAVTDERSGIAGYTVIADQFPRPVPVKTFLPPATTLFFS